MAGCGKEEPEAYILLPNGATKEHGGLVELMGESIGGMGWPRTRARALEAAPGVGEAPGLSHRRGRGGRAEPGSGGRGWECVTDGEGGVTGGSDTV